MVEPVWDELFGQDAALEQLRSAALHRAESLNHAWLITGPPGSGRSNAATAFAAALVCENYGCGECQNCLLIAAGVHPDVQVLATDRVQISIEEVRQLVADSHLASRLSPYRVMIIEDADRMTERTSNVLLKALEEPPPGTIWVLCAPSEVDMLPTVRSRVRKIALRVPPIEVVAQLLVKRHGIAEALARDCAREAQSHIGMASRLAVSTEARERRRKTLEAAAAVKDLGSALDAASLWLEIAKNDANAMTEERDAAERDKLLRGYGLGSEDEIPKGLRPQLKRLEESQKRRATRSLRDGLDRIFVDLLSLYRDVLTVQLQTKTELVNERFGEQIARLAARSAPPATMAKLDALNLARERIAGNVRDILALEALATELI